MCKYIRRYIIAVAFMSLPANAGALQQAVAGTDEIAALEPTAKQLLEKLRTVYATCTSYCDVGTVRTSFSFPAGTTTTVEKRFTTAFIRPNRFRFEYKASSRDQHDISQCVIWMNGDSVRTWWHDRPKVQIKESISLAIAEAVGVSDGAAHAIPVLLLPKDVAGRKLPDVPDPVRLDNTTDDVTDHVKIKWQVLNGTKIIWIDSRTMLITKIESKTNFGNFSAISTTTYNPLINCNIPDEKLVFTSIDN